MMDFTPFALLSLEPTVLMEMIVMLTSKNWHLKRLETPLVFLGGKFGGEQ